MNVRVERVWSLNEAHVVLVLKRSLAYEFVTVILALESHFGKVEAIVFFSKSVDVFNIFKLIPIHHFMLRSGLYGISYFAKLCTG